MQILLQHSLAQFTKEETRAEQMKNVEKTLFELYKDEKLVSKPVELEKRGGAYYSDAACTCIEAIQNDKKINMVVSTVNKGAIPCLAMVLPFSESSKASLSIWIIPFICKLW